MKWILLPENKVPFDRNKAQIFVSRASDNLLLSGPLQIGLYFLGVVLTAFFCKGFEKNRVNH